MQNGIFKKAWYLPGFSGKFTGMGVKGMWHYLISYYSVISLGFNLQIGEITCIIIKKKKRRKAGREEKRKTKATSCLSLQLRRLGLHPVPGLCLVFEFIPYSIRLPVWQGDAVLQGLVPSFVNRDNYITLMALCSSKEIMTISHFLWKSMIQIGEIATALFLEEPGGQVWVGSQACWGACLRQVLAMWWSGLLHPCLVASWSPASPRTSWGWRARTSSGHY